DVDSFALPASLFLSAIALLFYPVAFRVLLKKCFLSIHLMVTSWFLIFLFGVFFSGDPDPSLFMIYVCMMPAGLYCGYYLKNAYYLGDERVVIVLIRSFYICAFFSFLHIVASFL